MRVRNGLWFSVCLGFGALGCDDGKTLSAREQDCRDICERYELCDDGTDVPDCESDCSSESFRSDRYFEVKRECVMDELSCNRLMGEASYLEDCIGDRLRDDQLSEDAEDLCRALANKVSDCEQVSDTSDVEAQCGVLAITLSSEYLESADDCTRERCSDVAMCFDDLADSYNTEISLYGN